MNKNEDRRNAIESCLFGIGFLLLILAIGFRDPKVTLILFILGLIGVVPVFFANLFRKDNTNKEPQQKRIDQLEQWIFIFGGCFYMMLILMKVIRGFGYPIANWMAYIWLCLIAGALICTCLREHLIKKAASKKKEQEPFEQKETELPKGIPVSEKQAEKTEFHTEAAKPEAPKSQPVKQKSVQEPEKKKIQPYTAKKAPAAKLPPKKAKDNTLAPLLLDGSQRSSYGDAELYELSLNIHDDVPSLLWSVSWRGGYSHADGAGNYIPIPPEILADHSGKTLIPWIKSVIPPATVELVNWENVETNPQISPWLRSAKPKQLSKAESMEKRLSKHWTWYETAKAMDASIAWDKKNGYQLIFRPERSPSVVVRKEKDEKRFHQYSVLYLASLRPKGIQKISKQFTPFAENHWAGRAERGTEQLYLEQWDENEYLLWYLAQDFDTQNLVKLRSEDFRYRIIPDSVGKETSLEAYLEKSGIKTQWSQWAVKQLSTNPAFTKIFRGHNHTVPEDPVPFSKLILYPSRVPYQKKNPSQILHEWQSGSFGTKFRNKVSLYGQRELICEHYIQGEYGPESDQEEMVHVWLSKNAELVHHIPLIHWGLSLRCSTLVPYAESVCVTINENPPPFSGRERILKTSRNRVGYDLPGWNLQSDMITLRFHSNSSWTLCQDRHWRDAPSGFPYHAFIEIKLLPGAENNDDEVLCKLISNLPWNDPNKAEDSSRNLYNWMNTDFLTEMIENLSAQVQANPMSHASVELDEVQTQLSRLASKN